MTQNASLTDDHVVDRTAQRALVRHQEAYTDEVRRLLDSGLELMRQRGTTKSPRVADIIEHAGLSRDAFYRHFASKEDLVAAIVEAGARRLVGYTDHQMQKEPTAEGRLRAWIRAVMRQAVDPEVAATTRAVLWNGGRVPEHAQGQFDPNQAIAELLVGPLGDLPSPDPRRDAHAIAEAVMGSMRAYIERAVIPTGADLDHLTEFCLRAAGITPTRTAPTAHTTRTTRAPRTSRQETR